MKSSSPKKLPGVFGLLKATVIFAKKNKGLFAKLIFWQILVVAVLSGLSYSETSQLVNTLVLILWSMAEIFAIRAITAGDKVTARDALYRGHGQLVPFVLVSLLLSLQLLPLAIGLWLLQVLVVGGITVGVVEQSVAAVVCLILAILSGYWLSTSALSVYISTLPKLTPLSAWRAAKKLASGRRVALGGRMLFIFVLLTLLVVLPLLVAPSSWRTSFNLLPVSLAIWLPLGHIYMYKLYRSCFDGKK